MYDSHLHVYGILAWLMVIVCWWYGYHVWKYKRLVIWILVVGYIYTWFELVENEIEKFRAGIPKECYPDKMSWLESSLYRLGYNKDACTEYYRQSFKIVWLLNPVTVFGHTLGLIANAHGYVFSAVLSYTWTKFLPDVLTHFFC